MQEECEQENQNKTEIAEGRSLIYKTVKYF